MITAEEWFDAALRPAEDALPSQPTRPPIVMGIDLSLTATGVARSDGTVSTISSSGRMFDNLRDRRDRIAAIAAQVVGMTPAGVDAIALESPAYASRSGHAHDRSGLWWMVVDALMACGFTVVEVAPTQRAKYATGKGNAGKQEVLLAVERRFPRWEISNDNEADAVVLCAMASRMLGHPIDDVPAAQAKVATTLHGA